MSNRISNRKSKNPKFKANKFRLRKGKSYNDSAYMLNNRTQTMGTGKTTIRVTKFYTFATNVTASFVAEVMDDAVSSQEFTRLSNDYTYCKLQRVSVIKLPAAQSTQAPNFIKFDWFNSDPDDVRYDDNSKLIPFNNIRPRIYRFRPPNTLLTVGSDKYNYAEWLITQNVANKSMPGYLKVTSTLPLNMIVETRWTFRGSKYIGPSSKSIIIQPKKVHDDPVDQVIFDLKNLGHLMEQKIDKQQEIEEGKEEEEDEKEEVSEENQLGNIGKEIGSKKKIGKDITENKELQKKSQEIKDKHKNKK